ncbi:TIR domain-containing protein [Granulicella arctica]|uniref:TIR domain-containing protein n=1 Tax=Granulicella arctica TaxID=940613 RepID=UPI0021E092D7|nr:TIR domain-containing protein [Granulicella arctica]
MLRKAFFSFHFDADNWRAAQVRNMHALEDNPPVSDNEWEQIKRGGDNAITKWIAGQMLGRSCAVVLVGAGTANRKWINHEIIKAWDDRKGVVGIRVHGLKDSKGYVSSAGANPFDYIELGQSKALLSTIVELKDPTSLWGSTETYSTIKSNIADWVEQAIQIRAQH